MLQIKKFSTNISFIYKFQLLFRFKALKNDYILKKKLTNSIILRSPKHFNIGKQKITNLNYKFINIHISKNLNVNTMLLINTNNIFKLSNKTIQTNSYLSLKSLKLNLKTKFIIKWLEY